MPFVSLDCSHWEWPGCYKAAAGQHKGRSGERTVVLETVCAHDLWARHIFASATGSNNDVTVLQQSPSFLLVVCDGRPPLHYSSQVYIRTGSCLYFPGDGILHKNRLLCGTRKDAEIPEDLEFNAAQEDARNEFESFYGTLYQQSRSRSTPRATSTSRSLSSRPTPCASRKTWSSGRGGHLSCTTLGGLKTLWTLEVKVGPARTTGTLRARLPQTSGTVLHTEAV